MKHLMVFGLGYSAEWVGIALLKKGWTVSGTVRSPVQSMQVKEAGFSPLLFGDRGAVEYALRSATHCLISVPPAEEGDPALSRYEEALKQAPHLRWLGYFSTIGVYGDLQGGWANEETPAVPGTERGSARLQVEQAWRAFGGGRGVPLDIFRLAGIYGPGRSPIDKVRLGDAQRIVKPGQVFNRIHVEDIAQTAIAAIEQERNDDGYRIFNVADDEPAPPQDVSLYAAKLIGVAPPPEIPFESAGMSPMARSFYAGNKRIRNDKIKRELGVKLKYPTYRDGLRALAGVSPGV